MVADIPQMLGAKKRNNVQSSQEEVQNTELPFLIVHDYNINNFIINERSNIIPSSPQFVNGPKYGLFFDRALVALEWHAIIKLMEHINY